MGVFAVAHVWPYVSIVRFRSPKWMMVGKEKRRARLIPPHVSSVRSGSALSAGAGLLYAFSVLS